MTKEERQQLFIKTHPNWSYITPHKKYPYKSTAGLGILQGGDKLREQVRIRDNHICQLCGKKWIKNNRRFDVHHLEKEMENTKNYNYDKYNQDKMITLCHKCHINLVFVKL